MALYEKMLNLFRDPSLINYAASLIRFTAHKYYFNHYFTQFTPELVQNYFKTKGFRTLGLLFLRSRSYHNKSSSGALKQNHTNVMIQDAKPSNRI